MGRYIALPLLLLPVSVYAGQPDLRQVYLNFEAAYLSNNADSVNRWLAQDAKISETLHVPGGRTSTVNISRSQLLESMRRMRRVNESPRASPDKVQITRAAGGKFCGTAAAEENVNISGTSYTERIVRTACFRSSGRRYKVTQQKIDVFYARR